MMRLHELARLALLALALGVVAPACDKAPPAAPPKPVPTDARALERSRERWSRIEKADWIAAYEYLAPEVKREQSVQNYLQRTANHIYKNMRVIEVAAKKDDMIFVRVGGLWTPNHPTVKKIKLEPGQTLTQDIEMIEIWRWIGDEWCYVRPVRPEEFAEQFPELQPNYRPPPPKPAVVPPPAGGAAPAKGG